MHKKITTALLMSWIAGAANAQPAPAINAGTTNTAPPPPALTLAAPESEVNQPRNFGLGPMIGEPMGLTTKFWFTDRSAIDGGIGWSLVDPDGLQLHADYLYHLLDLIPVGRGQLPLYFGVGGRVKFVEHGDNRAGLRGPVGLSYLIPNSRVEIFAEVAPILDFSPSVSLEWNGGVGMRFYLR